MSQIRQNHSSFLQWSTLAAILGTFAVNVGSNLAPLNGQTIGEISNTLFAGVKIVPANYAFAIWGLIYLGLIGFGVYQLRPAQQTMDLQAARILLIVACIAQAFWVFCFLSRQFWLSVVAMLMILLPLIRLYLKLDIARYPVSRAEKWLVQVPFSIYLGWISVATIVNVALALYSQGWNGFGMTPTGWTVILISITATIGALMNIQRRDVAYPLVIVWALIAVAVKQASVPLISTTAIGLGVGLGLLIILRMRSSFSTNQHQP